MILPLELRIDNMVLYKGEHMKVFSINFRDAQMCAYAVLLDGVRSKMGVPVTDIEPIPLTPEILVACGFTNQNYGWSIREPKEYYDSRFGLFDFNYGKGKLKLKLNGSNLPMPDIKYLHELQNCFFSLTGTELEYKPTGGVSTQK